LIDGAVAVSAAVSAAVLVLGGGVILVAVVVAKRNLGGCVAGGYEVEMKDVAALL
jgi:hypothetical protein